MPDFIRPEMKLPAAAAITLTGSAAGSSNGAMMTRAMAWRHSTSRSSWTSSAKGAEMVTRTSWRRLASAKWRTTMIRLMPSWVALSFWVQPST